MSTALLAVDRLSVQKQTRRLLANISFSIQPGELVGIIGPNGAGKSTLLKALVGIYPAAPGCILVQGKDLNAYTAVQRARYLSYLSQYQQSAFPFRVSDTVLLGAYSRERLGQPRAELIKRAQTLVQQLKIEHLWHRSLSQLSGGETQLVHFCRLLLQDTPLMLLDEPTASLDIGHETHLMNAVKTHCHNGKSALVAIHNLSVAAAFCDRLLLVHQGELIAIGTAEEVITQQRLSQVYQHDLLVSRHPISGALSVMPKPSAPNKTEFRVHLVGGAGSTVALARNLLQLGIEVTAGIGHEEDSDTQFWQTTGIEHIAVAAFSAITDSALEQATTLVEKADLTIMTEFPIGAMNAANLRLAAQARTLWMLEETHSDPQDRIYDDIFLREFLTLRGRSQRLTAKAALQRLREQASTRQPQLRYL